MGARWPGSTLWATSPSSRTEDQGYEDNRIPFLKDSKEMRGRLRDFAL